jgi:outer membrane protein assembly factor BamB
VYLLVFGGSDSKVINLSSQNKNQIIFDDYYFLQRGQFYHDRINDKIRIVCHNSESTYFFTFDQENNEVNFDGNLLEDYYFDNINVLIGNFDLDAEIETAILKSNKIVIVNLESRVIEKEILIEDIPIDDFAIHTFQIKYNEDIGQFESWRPISNDEIEVINLQTEEKRIQNIVGGSITRMKFENLDQDRALELVTLNDSKLIVYDDNFDVLFQSFETINISKFSHNDIIICDNQNDSFKEINIGSNYGAFEYSLLNPYRDISLPEITDVKPINNSNGISIGTIVEFTFSKFMEVDSIKAYLDVSNSLGESLPYILEFDDENYLLKVSPSTVWPIQEQLSFKFSNELKDPFENPLDGNRNGIIEGELDDFIVNYTTGEDSDIIPPKIEVTVNTEKAYQGSYLYINGVISDSSSIAMSNIVYLEYFVDQDVVPGEGIGFQPTDESFDAIMEPFIINFLTAGLDHGDHVISFHGKDEYDNWSNVKSIDFEIIKEDIANWSSYSANTLNHSSNTFSNFKAPFELKYEIDQDPLHHRFKTYKPILVDDYLILNRDKINATSILEVRNIHSGEIVWTYSTDDISSIHPPTYAYGNIYFQVNTSEPNSKLICLDLRTGNLNWEKEYNGRTLEAFGPVVNDGKVYIVNGSTTSFLGAFDAYKGEEIFNTSLTFQNYRHWGPAVYDSLIYCHTENFFGIDKNSGEILVNNDQIPLDPIGFDIVGSTIIDTLNNQFILSSPVFIFAVDMESQNINWTITDSIDWHSEQPAIIGNNLYTISRTKIAEYDLKTGQQTWRRTIENQVSISYEPVANKDIVAFSNLSNTFVFDRNTKELLLELDQGGRMAFSKDYFLLAVDKGNIIVYEWKDIVSLANQLKFQNLSIYPNLGNGEINIHSSEVLNNVQLKIINITGQEILSYNFNKFYKENLNLSKLNNGLYFLHFRIANEYTTKKIIIQK